MFTSREELMWASGLFEGEGWICIQGKSPLMGIQMCDKDILEKIQIVTGLGKIYYRKPKVYSYEIIKTRKEQWAWRVQGFHNCQALIAMLWMGLGTRRRNRAVEVLAIARTGNVKPGMVKGTILGPRKKKNNEENM